MNETISFRQVDALVEGKDKMLGRVIEESCRKINYHEEQIRLGCDSLIRRAERVVENLDRGYNLNELGEFQSSAPDIDRHITQRHAAWQTLGLILSQEELDSIRPKAS